VIDVPLRIANDGSISSKDSSSIKRLYVGAADVPTGVVKSRIPVTASPRRKAGRRSVRIEIG
jgi:hypothetical protein